MSKVIRRDRSDIFRNWLGIAAAALYFACGALANAADEDNSGPISVTDVRGDVTLTQRGKSQKPRVGTKVTPPASVFTGVDSSVELRQGHTTVAVSANTTLDIPSSGLADSRIERIVQSRGSAFYRVGKRASQKLRVETPYLVAVVKGTQFNVVVQSDNTTIALFEGELEIRSTDGNDVVQLNAGEIAIRHGTDTTIRVLRMDTGEALRGQLEVQGPALAGGTDGGAVAGAVAPGFVAGGPQAITIGGALPSRGGDVGVAPGGAATPGTVAATGSIGGVGVGASVGVGGDTGLGATANLGQGGMNLSVAAATQTIDAGLTLNSSATGLGLGATANLGAAGAVITAGADIGIGNGGLGATAGVTADVAGLGATVNIGATANLGAGSVAVTTGASASLGGLNANLGLGAAADLGAGSVAVNTSTSVAGVTAGASVTAGSGGIAANANVAGIAVSLPTVGLPVITAPAVTAPVITTPVITTPAVSVPAVTTPTITTPVITVPAVTLPAITVPAITVPVITLPPVVAPGGGLGGFLGRLGGRH